MIKHSSSKKYKKKHTIKIYKGGDITDTKIPGMITKIDITEITENLIDKIFTKITCLFTPLCSFVWVKDNFIYSMKLLNDMLLISGLYFKNLLYLGHDSNLNNILPKNICFDLFDERICNTKIKKLINIKSKSEYNKYLPKELRYLQNMKGGRSKKKQVGGSGSIGKTCKNNKNPQVICYDDRSNINEMKPVPKPKHVVNKTLLNLQKLNLSVKNTVFVNMETSNLIILGEIRYFNIYKLYKVLNILKILYTILKTDVKKEDIEIEKEDDDIYKIKKNDILRIEHNFKKYENIKDWKECNDLHLEKVLNKEKRDYLINKCNITCKDCTMTKQSQLYIEDNTNYNPKFGECFIILEKILNNYYEYNKSKTYNHEDIYILLNTENKRIQFLEKIEEKDLFEFFNIGEPLKINEIEEDIKLELINIAKLHKKLYTHNTVSKYLLYLLFKKSTKYEKMNFKNEFLNTNGESLDKLMNF